MKTNVALVLAVFLGGIGYPTVSKAQVAEAPSAEDMPQPASAPPPLDCSEADSYQYFYQPLTPYGTWAAVGSYGYCWRPGRVAAGWRPYCEGHWAWTPCGWTWLSEEPWGWACYHYGRWVMTAECGWVWVPGREWAPAWVSWRHGPDFVAWAPLAPGVAIGVGFGDVAFGFDVAWWTCVPCRDFLAPRCSVVALSVDRCREVLPRVTTVANVATVNNIIVNPGPSRRQIQAATGRPVPQLALRSTGATAGARTRVSGGTVIAATPTAAMRSKPLDPARVQRVQNVTVVKTDADARRAAQSQAKPLTATAAAGTKRGGATAVTQTPQKANTPEAVPANASSAQPGTVRTQTANPEKRVWQMPQKVKTPETAPQTTTPGAVKTQPVQPEKTAPPMHAPQGTTGAQPRETSPKENTKPAGQVHAPPASPSRVAPPSTTPAAPPRERIEKPKAVEGKRQPPAAAPSAEKGAAHPSSPPPSQSSGGEEKGKPKEKP